jgi:hypothetical protein
MSFQTSKGNAPARKNAESNHSNVITAVVPTEIAEVRTEIISGNRSLFSRRDFAAGDIISEFGWRAMYSAPTYLTVQLSDTEHGELFPEYLECINHSCDPNCFFDTSTFQLVALKPIMDGEELGFFYPSAEWDMDQSFQCNCGKSNCVGVIRGAKYLTDNQIRKYRFTDFIQLKLASRS